MVIDGQQRCTTFCVLIRAILDVCDSTNQLSANQITRLIDCVYKVSENNEGDEIYTPKLLLSNPDKKTFDSVMKVGEDRSELCSLESNEAIIKAYQYFYNYFSLNVNQIKPFYMRLIAENNISKIARSGVNGQFRPSRHINRMMVEMMDSKPIDFICDPACGTSGFPVTSGDYLRERYKK